MVVASHNGNTTSAGEWQFSVRLVAGEVVSVKRDPNPTRGFKVRVRLQEKSGVKTEVAVGAAAVVRAEYATELGEGELKTLLALGHVPIVAEKRAWKKSKERGVVGVLPRAEGPQPAAAAGPPPAEEENSPFFGVKGSSAKQQEVSNNPQLTDVCSQWHKGGFLWLWTHEALCGSSQPKAYPRSIPPREGPLETDQWMDWIGSVAEPDTCVELHSMAGEHSVDREAVVLSGVCVGGSWDGIQMS